MTLSSQAQRTLDAGHVFFSTTIDEFLQQAITGDGHQSVLDLFQQVSTSVPAYRELLAQQGIRPETIQTIDDFRQLPILTKQNYCQAFPLAERCWQGQLEQCDLLAMSSGSTGEPTVWPRFTSDEYAIAQRFEQVFRESFQAHQRLTLAVVCFPMGTRVGGIFTMNCCRHLASKGYPLTVIAPGNQPSKILRVVKTLGSQFQQIVLLGYPPFLKGVVDVGLEQGLNWSKYAPKLVLAEEVFSEAWRDLMGDRLGMKDPVLDTASLYGTADAGVLGNETPLSITIRRWLAARPAVSKALFGQERLPTLVQYDPTQRFFETQEDTLLFSGDNDVPIIRYHIADTAGILGFEQMLNFLAAQGYDPLEELPSGIVYHQLPFVYVFSRANFVLSYYGANLYPENIAISLEQRPWQEQVTGKFVMEIRQDSDQNPQLVIAIECALAVDPSQIEVAVLAPAITEHVCLVNSEYANYVPSTQKIPLVELYPYGDRQYFPPGVKHRYTR